jgi:ribose transport system permease protein
MRTRGPLLLLNAAPLLLLLAVGLVFGVLSPRFLDPQNLGNIVVQSSSTAIVAIGMTFVLLTAGVDLSVGAIMFVAAAVAGKLAAAGAALPVTLAAMLAVGAGAGALNALCVTRLAIVPFIATLALMYAGRGFALWLTETRSLPLPPGFLAFGSDRIAGIPIPILLLAAIALAAHLALAATPFGRQVYAVGQSRDAAKKAGVATGRILAAVYIVCGLCAAAGAIVSASQLGVVSATFGMNKEFTAIAAAVLGGTSLFGGRGRVLPGTILGAVLMQTIENGLVLLNANPYLYPLFTAAIIFLAVALDSLRNGLLAKLTRRTIRPA